MGTRAREFAKRVQECGGRLAPFLVRLAWHTSGTYDKETHTGGSDGCTIRFAPEINYGANAGLGVAQVFLEPVKRLFPGI